MKIDEIIRYAGGLLRFVDVGGWRSIDDHLF